MRFDTDHLDHPHMAFAAMESASLAGSADERRWLKWVEEVERLLGHSLDGDEITGRDGNPPDCYSIDGGYKAFEEGRTPESYVTSVHAAEVIRAINGGPKIVRAQLPESECRLRVKDLIAALQAIAATDPDLFVMVDTEYGVGAVTGAKVEDYEPSAGHGAGWVRVRQVKVTW